MKKVRKPREFTGKSIRACFIMKYKGGAYAELDSVADKRDIRDARTLARRILAWADWAEQKLLKD